MIGVPDLWNDSMASVSTKHSNYQSSIWSPCGCFVAVVTKETVEIRGALALNIISTLQSARVCYEFMDSLAYSSDGCSLACCSDTAIIIWDTQTGGVVRKIDYKIVGNISELVWSLDGNMISIISPLVFGTFTVCVYEVMSGTMQLSSTVKSQHSGHLWAHNKSFQVMTTTGDDEGSTINIYEVGFTFTKVEWFHFQSLTYFEVFSPAKYRISASADGNRNSGSLLILNVHNSEVLLQESGFYWHITFSPDGDFVAASTGS